MVSNNKKECDNRQDCQVSSRVILREGRQDGRIAKLEESAVGAK